MNNTNRTEDVMEVDTGVVMKAFSNKSCYVAISRPIGIPFNLVISLTANNFLWGMEIYQRSSIIGWKRKVQFGQWWGWLWDNIFLFGLKLLFFDLVTIEWGGWVGIDVEELLTWLLVDIIDIVLDTGATGVEQLGDKDVASE